ncbi:multidrug transporter EmrE-like cation transporter [Gracilibacillus alcaliphilus]|nr:multidrug transporter EmrE-like cation transporter [Gracilibacillus alcaliphilus]
MIFYKESRDRRIIYLGLIVAAVIGLRFVG